MVQRRPLALACAAVLGGCYTPPDPPPTEGAGALEPTEVVFQAVDAGTGSALQDDEMTIRYLVRRPIFLDVTSVDRVPSIEPYEISHEIGTPELVLEIRVEASSYHRLDTVLTVPRGQSAGPLTVRLSRRLGRSDGVQASGPSLEPADTAPAAVSAATQRGAMREGNRAFERQAWLDATEAYQRMPEPDDETSEYGRDYLEAKIRQGVAHINRSEFARALEIFEEVVAMESPGANAYLRLAQTQCAVGRTDEGRGTLAQIARSVSRMRALQRSTVNAMVAYQRGVCTHGEFQRAQTTRERVRAGAEATQQLNAFVEGARAMSPVPPQVYNAVQDAERRVEEMRRAMGGG